MAFDAGSIVSTLEVNRDPWKAGLKAARQEGRDFAKEVYKAKLELDVTKARADAKAAKADLQGLSGTITTKWAFDVAKGRADAKAARSDLQGISGTVNAKWALDLGKGRADAKAARADLQALNTSITTKWVFDVTKGRADLQAVDRLLSGLDGRVANTSLRTDATAAYSDLVDYRTLFAEVNGKKATTRISLDGAAAAIGETAGVSQELDRVDGRTARARVDVDASSAGAATGQVSTLMYLAGMLAPALVPIGGAALGAFGGIATGATIALPALIATALGVSGVSDAVKALSDQQKKSATTGAAAASSARQQATAAASLASAERSLSNARDTASEAAVRSQAAIDDAYEQAAEGVERAVERERDAEKARIAAIGDRERAVKAAERADRDAQEARDGIVTASHGVVLAEQREVKSKEDLRTAEQDLTSAREDARRSIEDLQFSVLGGALAERRAQLQLREALKELQAAAAKGIGGDELEKLKLNYEEAALRVKELGVQNSRLRTEQEQTNRSGVEGSRQVVAAQGKIADANDRVAQAAEGVATAQNGVRDAIRRASDADDAAAEARDRVTQATEKVSEATRDVGRAAAAVSKARTDGEEKVREAIAAQTAQQRQSAAAIESALAGVEAANRQVQAAQEAASTAGASGADKVAEAMKDLSPQAQEFARYLVSIKDHWTRLTQTAQAGLLPGLQDGIEAALKSEPQLLRMVDSYSRAMGNLARSTGEGLGSKEWQDWIDWLSAQATPTIDQFGRIAGGSLTGLAGTVRGFAPVWYQMGDGLESFTDRFAKWGQEVGSGKNQQFNEFLAYVKENGPHVVDTLGNLVDAGVNVARGLAPVGAVVLAVANAGLQLVAALPPGVITAITLALMGFFTVLKGAQAVNAFKRSIDQVQLAGTRIHGAYDTAKVKVGGFIDTMAMGVRSLGNVGPATVAAGGHLDTLGARAVNAGGQGGIGKLAGAAGGLVGFLGGPWGFALMAAGVGVGLLTDHLMKNSQRAEEARARQDELRTALNNSKGAIDSNVQSLVESQLKQRDLAIASGTLGEAADQLGLTMNNLGGAVTGTDVQFQAQIDKLNAVAAEHELTKGTVDAYGHAVGPTYDSIGQKARGMADEITGARDEFLAQQEASLIYRASVNGITTDQQRLNDALQTTTDKLIAQANADLAFRQNKLGMEDAQRRLNDAITQYGQGSPEAQRAALDLEGAQLRYIESARTAKGATDGSKESIAQQRQAILDVIATIDGPLPASIASLVANMDLASLRAMGARFKIDEMGNAIAVLPGGKEVVLSAPNAAALKGTQEAKDAVANLKPGHEFVLTADPKPATDTLNDFEKKFSGQGEAQAQGFWSRFWDSFGGGGPTPEGKVAQPRANTPYRPYGGAGGGIVAAAGVGPLQFARGGVISGYAPGVDDVPALLSRGEAVLVPELVAAIGPQNILDANKRFSGRAGTLFGAGAGGVATFAGGGVTGAVARPKVAPAAAVPAVSTVATAPIDPALTGEAADAIDALTAAVAALNPVTANMAAVTAQDAAAVGASTSEQATNTMALGAAATAQQGAAAAIAGTTAQQQQLAAATAAGSVQLGGNAAAATAAAAAIAGTTGQQQQLAAATAAGSVQLGGNAAAATAAAAAIAGTTGQQQQLAAATAAGSVQLGGNATAATASTTALQQNAAALGAGALAQGQVAAAAAGTTGAVTATTGVIGAATGALGQVSGALGLATGALNAGRDAASGQQGAMSALLAGGVTPLTGNLSGILQPALAETARLAGGVNVQALQVLEAQTAPVRTAFGDTATTVRNAATEILTSTQQWQNVSVDSTGAINQALAGTRTEFGLTSGSIQGSLQQAQDKANAVADGIGGALGRARDAMLETSTWSFVQFNALKTNISDAIKWVMQWPLGEPGLVGAWNHLDATFALNKHVNPYPPGFATGGPVSGPGTATSDDIPAMLSDGEFVVRSNVASRVPEFLKALNAGQTEAMQAAGAGRQVDPKMRVHLASGGPVVDAVNRTATVAASMNGTPYVWGGASRHGADCSGYQSIITNSLRGDANPYHRLGTTATMPWSGFAGGLNGAYTVGNIDNASGGIGHMAGTLVVGDRGVNVESGSGHGPMFGGPSIGADNPLFNEKYFLPQIGGKFVSGGMGGSALDVAAMVAPEFDATRKLIADAAVWFGSGRQVQIPQGVATAGVDAVQNFGVGALGAVFGGGSGGAGVERWRGVVNQALTMMSLPLNLANTTLRRMDQESSGDPGIVNDWDINAINGTPSVGLMQVIGPTYRANKDGRHDVGPYVHGVSIDPLSNILASMHYTLGRYGSLPAGYDRAGGYDNGGPLLPGRTLVENRSGQVENVLTARESDALVNRINGDTAPDGPGLLAALEQMTTRIETALAAARAVHVHPRAEQSEESIGTTAARYADRANRRTR